ncbi:MAG: M20/M25/M40 family metallo-hydrolase [Chloroflexi bacterium]|nr:M20/M25/M40 family metallo-hydrolase [Chloroflexota bacterium]
MVHVEEILSKLIQIKSVNPPGGETEAAKYLKGLFDAAGVRNEIIESAPGRGNFFAYLGEGSRRIVFLAHTDVVPVTPGWDVDPFSGAIQGGEVWGRGALDCKSLVAAEAYAMLELARQPDKLKGQLVFAATADEEVGGTYGVKYLVERHPDKLRADFVVNEGAEAPLKINGKLVYFIQAGEKGAAWTTLKTRGVSAHGSVPTLGENAVVKMAEAVARLSKHRTEIVLIPEVRTLIQSLVHLRGDARRVTKSSLDGILDGFPDRAFREYLRAITRMTISPNFIQGGIKTNIVPDNCTADVDIRVLPGQGEDALLEQVRRLAGKDVEASIPDFNQPSFSPSDLPGYRSIDRTIKDVLGDVTVLPCISSGATDSRFLRKAGIPSYGVAVMDRDTDPALQLTVHGRNERVDVKSLEVQARFFVELARGYLWARA